MDSNTAFREINYIFNSLENKEKSNSWKLDELRKVLNNLQKEAYKAGIERGFRESKKLLNEFDINKLLNY